VAEVRRRLPARRSRPLLVEIYAAIACEGGILGPGERRRFGRFLLRSAPAAVTAALAAALASGLFAAPSRAPAQAAALLGLGATLGAVLWRHAHRDGGRATPLREQLELGALLLVAAHAVAQASEGLGGDAGAAPLQPAVYLVMAFLAAVLTRAASFGLAALALALEAGIWWGRGAARGGLVTLAVHAGFLLLFGALYRLVLGTRVAAGRRAEEASVARRRRELDERAREFRLLSPESVEEEGESRWADGAVVELEAAVRGVVEVGEQALRSHTCAVFLLSDDDRELRLRECRSASDRVVREPLPAGEGPLGAAVKGRTAVRLAGGVKGAGYYGDGTRPGALLAVPIVDRRGGHVRGVLIADRLEEEPFGDADEQLLSRLAAELVRAVQAERLMGDLRRTRAESERFYQAIERLNRTAKPREVFDALLELAGEMTAVDFGAVTLCEEAGGKRVHRVVRARAVEELSRLAELEGRCFEDNPGLVSSAVRLASSLPGKELKGAEAMVFDPDTRLKGISALKVIPLKTGGEVLGTLVVGARRRAPLDADTQRQLEVVAIQAAESVLRARLFEQTERLATTDGLTGLLNHRTFQARLDEALGLAARYGKKLSFILCDVDHFKKVNDTYGHPAGDVVLRGVARVLAAEARSTDVVARYGGEEFALVMPETDGAGALVIAERIREKVQAACFETEQGALRVTLSLGIATCPDDGTAKAQLVELADGGLYFAKRNGRNQAVSAEAVRAAKRAAG
jgi:diguanylate cyclase (GGDEF)-like protein